MKAPSIELCLFSYAGVDAHCVDSLIAEVMLAQQRGIRLQYARVSDDALISRSRSVAATRFLDRRPPAVADVLFMVDRDISWKPGDVIATAQKAVEQNALVAGLYAVRDRRKGVSSRLAVTSSADESSLFQPGGDKLLAAEYLATGFLAIPRRALTKMVVELERSSSADLKISRCCSDGAPFWDLFRCVTRPTTLASANAPNDYLSEDYAFGLRAAACGVQSFIYEKPLLDHWGVQPFGVFDS